MRKIFLLSVMLLILAAASPLNIFAQKKFVAHLEVQGSDSSILSPSIGSCSVTLFSNPAGNLTDSGKQTKQSGGSITLECSFPDLSGTVTEMDIRGPGDKESVSKINFALKPNDAKKIIIKTGVIAFNEDQINDLRAKKLFVVISVSKIIVKPKPSAAAGGSNPVEVPNAKLRGLIQDANLVSDFDGDGRTDFVFYRPYDETFDGALNDGKNGSLGYRSTSSTGDQTTATPSSMGDFDGDGRSDYVLVTSSNNQLSWIIFQSIDNAFHPNVAWGNFALGDILVPADYDGDGKQDIAVFRRTTGVWYIIESSTNKPRYEYWGKAYDLPSVGDFDGDGKADLTVVRDVKGHLVWYTRRSSDGVSEEEIWGLSGTDGFFFSTPVDYDGDGLQDRLVFRKDGDGRNVFWILSKKGAGQVQWGLASDDQIVGDFDGDGRTDLAARRVVDNHVEWWISQSSDGKTAVFNYKTPGPK